MVKSVLIFGLGPLQESLIRKSRAKGLCTIGIDPCENPWCKNLCDVFYCVAGQDYEGTLEVARRHEVSAVLTAATDKPLVMMAKVAKELGLKFYSEDTAVASTDKYLMKQRFMQCGIPCASGRLITSPQEARGMAYPLIVKPCDNSGSRGVKLCRSEEELSKSMEEAFGFTRKKEVLVENFIKGKEYSIESLHTENESYVIQFTEKKTTDFPYNVELGHIQPADLSENTKDRIRTLIRSIADCLDFRNCASHTELKIDGDDIYVIETSPRTGGDYITSSLTELSSGIDMESLLIDISMGGAPAIDSAFNPAIDSAGNPAGNPAFSSVDTSAIGPNSKGMSSAVGFFSLEEGTIEAIDKGIETIRHEKGVADFSFDLKEGDRIRPITNSLDRYGHIIVCAPDRKEVEMLLEKYMTELTTYIHIKP